MSITRQMVVDQITGYLHGTVSQEALVNWAEHAMMDTDFDGADSDLLGEVIGQLGLADVAEFGLRWHDCEKLLRRLGYHAVVTVTPRTGTAAHGLVALGVERPISHVESGAAVQPADG